MDFKLDKLQAATEFLTFLKPNLTVGLGTGSNVEVLMKLIFEQKLHSKLNLKFVYSSKRTKKVAIKYNFVELTGLNKLDLVVDGADVILENGNLIKGLGGALFRERVLADLTDNYYIIAQSFKLKNNFDGQIVPIEIASFGCEVTLKKLTQFGGKPVLRQVDNQLFETDNHNLIADTFFEKIPNPDQLADQIKLTNGVLAHGLFINYKPTLILGSIKDKVKIIQF